MRGKRFISTTILLGLLFSLCSCMKSASYFSPEEFCQAKGYDYYQIVPGESSVFVMYEESPSKVGFDVLLNTNEGFVPINCHVVLKEFFGPSFATIYKGSGVDDNYIFLVLSGSYNTDTIKDARGSTFYFLPVFALTDDKTEIGCFACAYIGGETRDFYKQDYWYVIGIEEDRGTGDGSLSHDEKPN